MVEKIKKSKIGRFILILIMDFLSVLNQIIPKKKKQILFYDSGRDFLDDNTEALYSWLRKNGFDKKYKFIVCVPKEKKRLSFSDYKPVGALYGVLAYLTSQYVFFSFGDFRIRPSKKQCVINQWHATPTKKIGKLTYDENYRNERLDNFTYIISSSETFVSVLAKAFGCNEDKVKVIGNARNDYLFSSKDAFKIIGINRDKYTKFILWMPTFRVSNDSRFHDGNTKTSETLLPIIEKYDDLDKLDKILSKRKVLLVIKIHPMALFKKRYYKNIIIVTNNDIIPKGVRLYEFVKEFDALITDYSSIYCDFLMLNRPIGFTLDDFEEYENSRGFVFDDFINYLPGQHLYFVKDIFKFVDNVAFGIDEFIEEREKMIPVFCKYTDGRNCEKLAEFAGLKLEG